MQVLGVLLDMHNARSVCFPAEFFSCQNRDVWSKEKPKETHTHTHTYNNLDHRLSSPTFSRLLTFSLPNLLKKARGGLSAQYKRTNQWETTRDSSHFSVFWHDIYHIRTWQHKNSEIFIFISSEGLVGIFFFCNKGKNWNILGM